jgi:hypothetical protein
MGDGKSRVSWDKLEAAEREGNFKKVVGAAIEISDQIGSFPKMERLLRERKHRLHLIAITLKTEMDLRFPGGRIGKGNVQLKLSTRSDADQERERDAGSREENLKALEIAGILTNQTPASLVEVSRTFVAQELVKIECSTMEEWTCLVDALIRNTNDVSRHHFQIFIPFALMSNKLSWDKICEDCDIMKPLKLSVQIMLLQNE